MSVRISVSEDDIQKLIGIISINAVGFTFKKERIQGRALYPRSAPQLN